MSFSSTSTVRFSTVIIREKLQWHSGENRSHFENSGAYIILNGKEVFTQSLSHWDISTPNGLAARERSNCNQSPSTLKKEDMILTFTSVDHLRATKKTQRIQRKGKLWLRNGKRNEMRQQYLQKVNELST